MTLAAAQVVDAVAARITGLALAGSRVFTSRAWPLSVPELPAWRVVAVDEDVDPQTVHGPLIQKHALQIELRGICHGVQDLDDQMHALCAQALTAVFSTPPGSDALKTLMSKLNLSLRRIERAMGAEGEAAVGLITVTLRAEYFTAATDPQTIL